MRIDDLIRHERMKGVEFSPKQEEVLMATFGACSEIECMVRFSKALITQSISMEKHCFILHEDYSMDKKPPKDNEVFFGVFINSFIGTTYIIAMPTS